MDEWDKLAQWIVNHKLYSHNVRWLIQIPRLYDVYKMNGSVEKFEDIVVSELLTSCRWGLSSSDACRCFQAAVRGYERSQDASRITRLPSSCHWL